MTVKKGFQTPHGLKYCSNIVRIMKTQKINNQS